MKAATLFAFLSLFFAASAFEDGWDYDDYDFDTNFDELEYTEAQVIAYEACWEEALVALDECQALYEAEEEDRCGVVDYDCWNVGADAEEAAAAAYSNVDVMYACHDAFDALYWEHVEELQYEECYDWDFDDWEDGDDWDWADDIDFSGTDAHGVKLTWKYYPVAGKDIFLSAAIFSLSELEDGSALGDLLVEYRGTNTDLDALPIFPTDAANADSVARRLSGSDYRARRELLRDHKTWFQVAPSKALHGTRNERRALAKTSFGRRKLQQGGQGPDDSGDDSKDNEDRKKPKLTPLPTVTTATDTAVYIECENWDGEQTSFSGINEGVYVLPNVNAPSQLLASFPDFGGINIDEAFLTPYGSERLVVAMVLFAEVCHHDDGHCSGTVLGEKYEDMDEYWGEMHGDWDEWDMDGDWDEWDMDGDDWDFRRSLKSKKAAAAAQKKRALQWDDEDDYDDYDDHHTDWVWAIESLEATCIAHFNDESSHPLLDSTGVPATGAFAETSPYLTACTEANMVVANERFNSALQRYDSASSWDDMESISWEIEAIFEMDEVLACVDRLDDVVKYEEVEKTTVVTGCVWDIYEDEEEWHDDPCCNPNHALADGQCCVPQEVTYEDWEITGVHWGNLLGVGNGNDGLCPNKDEGSVIVTSLVALLNGEAKLESQKGTSNRQENNNNNAGENGCGEPKFERALEQYESAWEECHSEMFGEEGAGKECKDASNCWGASTCGRVGQEHRCLAPLDTQLVAEAALACFFDKAPAGAQSYVSFYLTGTFSSDATTIADAVVSHATVEECSVLDSANAGQAWRAWDYEPDWVKVDAECLEDWEIAALEIDPDLDITDEDDVWELWEDLWWADDEDWLELDEAEEIFLWEAFEVYDCEYVEDYSGCEELGFCTISPWAEEEEDCDDEAGWYGAAMGESVCVDNWGYIIPGVEDQATCESVWCVSDIDAQWDAVWDDIWWDNDDYDDWELGWDEDGFEDFDWESDFGDFRGRRRVQTCATTDWYCTEPCTFTDDECDTVADCWGDDGMGTNYGDCLSEADCLANGVCESQWWFGSGYCQFEFEVDDGWLDCYHEWSYFGCIDSYIDEEECDEEDGIWVPTASTEAECNAAFCGLYYEEVGEVLLSGYTEEECAACGGELVDFFSWQAGEVIVEDSITGTWVTAEWTTGAFGLGASFDQDAVYDIIVNAAILSLAPQMKNFQRCEMQNIFGGLLDFACACGDEATADGGCIRTEFQVLATAPNFGTGCSLDSKDIRVTVEGGDEGTEACNLSQGGLALPTEVVSTTRRLAANKKAVDIERLNNNVAIAGRTFKPEQSRRRMQDASCEDTETVINSNGVVVGAAATTTTTINAAGTPSSVEVCLAAKLSNPKPDTYTSYVLADGSTREVTGAATLKNGQYCGTASTGSAVYLAFATSDWETATTGQCTITKVYSVTESTTTVAGTATQPTSGSTILSSGPGSHAAPTILAVMIAVIAMFLF